MSLADEAARKYALLHPADQAVIDAIIVGALELQDAGIDSTRFFAACDRAVESYRRKAVGVGEDDGAVPALCPTSRAQAVRPPGRPRAERPFPMAPLLAQCNGEISALALRLGLTKRSIHRFVTLGLSEVNADRFAVATGMHPAEVWGDLWWSTVPGEEALTAVAG